MDVNLKAAVVGPPSKALSLVTYLRVVCSGPSLVVLACPLSPFVIPVPFSCLLVVCCVGNASLYHRLLVGAIVNISLSKTCLPFNLIGRPHLKIITVEVVAVKFQTEV